MINALAFVDIALFAATLVLIMICSFTKPGYIEAPKTSFTDLLIAFEPTLLCPDCKVIRTTRSRHCVACNRCVERFDHHCPWINNCIGIRNHNYFYSYILT